MISFEIDARLSSHGPTSVRFDGTSWSRPPQPVEGTHTINRRWHNPNSSCSGYALLNCTYTRRTLTVTCAATFKLLPGAALLLCAGLVGNETLCLRDLLRRHHRNQKGLDLGCEVMSGCGS